MNETINYRTNEELKLSKFFNHYDGPSTAIYSEEVNLIKSTFDHINKALELAYNYGQIDGEHHKTWVIDQIVRELTGETYQKFINEYEIDDDGNTYEWDKGIAP